MTDPETPEATAARLPLLDLIILDCPEPDVLARFYGGLLGWEVEDTSDRDWAALAPPGGGVAPDRPDGRATLGFQRVDDWVAPTWPGGQHPQQFHLDFSVDDIDAAEPRVLELGAVRADHQPSTDGGFRVFLDPAGHPFCLIR
ncbi:VOC family protein [uncultured Friedmanniella sp.]|uniref:VOC family protein n=1 Tax=uncultured Friedmanniella sp. TaxID=335381 RepID=UPI0035CBB315